MPHGRPGVVYFARNSAMGDTADIPRTGNRVTFQDEYCFVCGKLNPIGLKLRFAYDRENRRATAEVTFGPEHQGWDGVVHGGILASVLDDVMAHSILTTDNLPITTKISVVYRKPVRVGETLHLEGTVEHLKSRTAVARATAYVVQDPGSDARDVRVEAEGTYYLDKPRGADKG